MHRRPRLIASPLIAPVLMNASNGKTTLRGPTLEKRQHPLEVREYIEVSSGDDGEVQSPKAAAVTRTFVGRISSKRKAGKSAQTPDMPMIIISSDEDEDGNEVTCIGCGKIKKKGLSNIKEDQSDSHARRLSNVISRQNLKRDGLTTKHAEHPIGPVAPVGSDAAHQNPVSSSPSGVMP